MGDGQDDRGEPGPHHAGPARRGACRRGTDLDAVDHPPILATGHTLARPVHQRHPAGVAGRPPPARRGADARAHPAGLVALAERIEDVGLGGEHGTVARPMRVVGLAARAATPSRAGRRRSAATPVRRPPGHARRPTGRRPPSRHHVAEEHQGHVGPLGRGLANSSSQRGHWSEGRSAGRRPGARRAAPRSSARPGPRAARWAPAGRRTPR